MNQRWRERRESYRPAGEVIATHLYEVAEIEDDSAACMLADIRIHVLSEA